MKLVTFNLQLRLIAHINILKIKKKNTYLQLGIQFVKKKMDMKYELN